MNWNRIEGNWKQVKGKVKEQWGKLTDDDFDVVGGRREQLAGSAAPPTVGSIPTPNTGTQPDGHRQPKSRLLHMSTIGM